MVQCEQLIGAGRSRFVENGSIHNVYLRAYSHHTDEKSLQPLGHDVIIVPVALDTDTHAREIRIHDIVMELIVAVYPCCNGILIDVEG